MPHRLSLCPARKLYFPRVWTAWRLRFRDLGSGYVGTIARALEDERVDWLEASYLLNAKTPMVQQMIDEYHRIENGA